MVGEVWALRAVCSLLLVALLLVPCRFSIGNALAFSVLKLLGRGAGYRGVFRDFFKRRRGAKRGVGNFEEVIHAFKRGGKAFPPDGGGRVLPGESGTLFTGKTRPRWLMSPLPPCGGRGFSPGESGTLFAGENRPGRSMCPPRRFLWRWLAAVALAAVSLTARAFDPYPNFTFATGADGLMTSSSFAGSAADWAAGAKATSSAGTTWTSAAKELPFKPATTLNMKALFSPANMGKAMTAGAAVAIPLAAAPLMSALLNQACVRAFGGAMTLAPGGQWEECKFTTSTYQQQQCAWQSSPVETDWKDGGSSVCWSNWVAANPAAPNTSRQNVRQFASYTLFDAYCSGTLCQQDVREDWNIRYKTVTQQQQNGWQASDATKAQSALTNTMNLWAAQGDSRLGGVLDELYSAKQPVDGALVSPTIQTPVMDPAFNTVKSDPATGKTYNEMVSGKNDYACIVISNGQALQCSQTKTTTTTTNTVDNATGTTTTGTTTVVTQRKDGETSACGSPGQPVCAVKVDETGTPAAPTLKLDEASIQTQATTNNTTISGSSDKGMFSGWSSVFVTPALVPCAPVSFTMMGGTAQTVNPCGVVDGVRSFMAYLWALAAFWVCLGWIREAI
jgi:hypothetical protein